MVEQSQNPIIQFTPEFKRNLRALAKKYRHIRDDVEPIIAQLQEGELPGEIRFPALVIPFTKCVYPIKIVPEAKAGATASSIT